MELIKGVAMWHELGSLLNFLIALRIALYTPLIMCSKINKITTLNNIEGKIIGGKPVDIERFPWSAQFFNYGSLCAGTILNSWSILTAAHCFDHSTHIDDMMIQIGSRYTFDFDAEIYDIQSFIIHPDYNRSMLFSSDIALIFVDRAIHFGNTSKKALLVDNDRWMKEKETEFTVTGWGWTKYGGPISKQGLMMTHLRFVSTKRCGELHKLKLTPDMFCLYGSGIRDSCKGDSGGGVLWKGMVVGVVSHGDGCAKHYKPSVYSNVWYFRHWIKKTVERFIRQHCHNSLGTVR